MLNIVTTPRYLRSLKKLKKQHKTKTIRKLEETINKLANFQITTQQHNHPLQDSDINDIHIEGDVILLYRYIGDGIVLDLELTNLVNHDSLNRKIRSNTKTFKPSILANDQVEDDLEHPDQEYDSAATSINTNKLPAIYKMVNFEPGKVYLDFGGGKFDNGVYFVKDKGATLLVYDPYNRSDEHNKQVLAELKENGGADAGLNSNVLNVIKEPQARLAVLKNLKRLVKPGGDIYITVYEGTGKGDERPTKAGYQLNRKTEGYMDEVRQIFPDAQRKGKLIYAVNSSTQPITITSGTVTDKVYWYFTRHGVQPGSIPKSIDTLYDVIDTPEGTYFATNTILNTKELSQYEIKEKWLPEKYMDQTDYFEHNRVVSASDCRVVSDDQYLTYCPNCHGDKFNDKTGLCLDCGYDEKSWGTGPYYDQSYDDDFDDYDHDYEPSHNDWNELYDVSSSDQLDDSIIDAEDLRGLSREQIEQILDEAPVGAEVIHIRNLENRFNMDALIRKKQAYKSNYFNPVGAPGDFNNLDTYWTVGGYENPYIDSTIYKAVNGTDKYYGLTSEVLKAHGITSSVHLGDEVEWNNQKYIVIDDEEGLRLRPVDRFSEDDFDDPESGDSFDDVYLEDFQIEGASYGGAYDVLDDYYFTRDDLVDFGEEVVAQLENIEPGDYFVNDLDMLNPKTIHIEVYCRNKETYADKNIVIDMRRIQKPSDLNKYAYQVALDMYDEFSEYDDVYSSSDYQIMKKSYKNSRKFRSQGDAEYLDFIDELEHKGVAHDQYDNLKDDGCTVFYDEPKTPIVSSSGNGRTFIQTHTFAKQWDELGLPDEYLRKLESLLLSNPEAGDVIRGSNGARKLRIKIEPTKGKSGGGRVIYVDYVNVGRIYLLSIYGKSNKANLSPQEVHDLSIVIRAIKEMEE